MIKKILLTGILIAVLSSISLAMNNVGFYEADYVVSSNNYVMRLPTILSNPALINNYFRIPLVPTIEVDSTALTVAPSVSYDLISGSKEKYTIEFTIEQQGLEISEKVEIRDNLILSRITVKNIENDEKTVRASYTLTGKGDIALFFPSIYTDGIDNYIVLLHPSLHGSSMGISTSMEIGNPGFENFYSTNSYLFRSGETQIKFGESVTYSVMFYPFNIQSQESVGYPVGYQSFKENKLITTTGSIDFSTTGTATEKLADMVSKMVSLPKGDAVFTTFHDVNLEGNLNSLGAALYFKAMCIQEGIPCRLAVGQSENNLYAWIEVYTGSWQVINPFTATTSSPQGYQRIYLEPEGELHTVYESTEQAYFDATAWLRGLGSTNIFIYLIIVVIFAAIAIIVVQLKAKKLSSYVSKETKLIKKQLEGQYKIVGGEVTDPLLKEVFELVKQTNGKVDIADYVHKLGYSEDLIKFGVGYLADNGIIVMTEKKAVTDNPEQNKKMLDKYLKKRKKSWQFWK